MITENLSTLKIHNLTQEQYERELAAGRIDENALYLTPYDGNKDNNINSDEFLKKAGDIMTGPLGFTLDIGYGQTIPSEGFEGQIFFVQDISEEEEEKEIISLPSFSESDNNKFLKIVNGAPTWTIITSAEGASF